MSPEGRTRHGGPCRYVRCFRPILHDSRWICLDGAGQLIHELARTMGTVCIAPGQEGWFAAEATRSLDAMTESFGMDLVTERHRTQVCQGTLTNDAGERMEVYFKGYTSPARFPGGFGRLSRGVLEARNLRNFKQWGIAAAEVLAWGARRRMAGLRSDLSFIVTRTVPRTEALDEFWTAPDVPASPELRADLITQLATGVRAMHARHFFHQDLKWRNVLVDEDHQLHWIDCPNGYFSRLGWRQRHGRLKDLATLDKFARDRCTRDERQRFLRIYLGTEDEAVVQQWSKAVAGNRKLRRP